MFRNHVLAGAAAFALFPVISVAQSSATLLTPIEQLGKSIFFDDDLSINMNQSCASCHDSLAGWTGPELEINEAGSVYEGSIPGRFGNRKPPTSAYATLSPVFTRVVEGKDSFFVGGNFWDGRATGELLGNPAADQAQGPFLNPVEQALPDNACVVYRVCIAAYPVTFEEVWGAGACAIAWPGNINAVCAMEGSTVVLSPSDRNMVDIDYDNIALSIAAFEGSSESNAFTSKFDLYLAGLVDLTPQEKKGYNLFKSKGKCDKCHVLEPGPGGEPPLFTDFNFENLGVPRNPQNPFYTQPGNPDGFDWVDLGLGGFLDTRPDTMAFASENYGKQKTPTLRNVDKRPVPGFVKAYAHNGYFKTLEGLVNFYNTRDVKPVCADRFTTEADALAQGCWPEPEVAANVNTSELGDLHLTASQEAAIVAFLRTLSDGYTP